MNTENIMEISTETEAFVEVSVNTQILEEIAADVRIIMVLALLTFFTSCLRGWRKNVIKGAK